MPSSPLQSNAARAAVGARTGSADLPLHGGRVPAWLYQRMRKMARVLTEAILLEYGRDEFLRRLSHPFWFHAFGAFMGQDWHSSGITTSVIGALKHGLSDLQWELGLHVCGGRGRHSRKTPDELFSVSQHTGLDGDALARSSRLVAKVDSAAVQDGFELYLHAFVVADDGKWVVIQQGMNTSTKRARRYHWLSEGLKSFVDSPHAAIAGPAGGAVLNLTDSRAASARGAQLQLVNLGPEKVVSLFKRAHEKAALPHLHLPGHHEVSPSDVFMRRLHGAVEAARERGPVDFADLLLTPGLGARSVLALALLAEVVHGAPCRFSDPARFSFAFGGKDGHPFPVQLHVYDQTLRVLRSAVDKANLGNDEKLQALRRLDSESQRLERFAQGESFDEWVKRERAESHLRGGMTVQGPARPPHNPNPSNSGAPRQLVLFP